ncbi:MAG: FeoA family protein [Proteocatella sp.]
MKTLNDLNVGEYGIVEAIDITGILKRRIIDMGLTKGCKVKIERVAPLGDPIDVRIKNSHIAIRKSDALNIILR